VDLGAFDGDFAQAIIERFHCTVFSAEPVKELFDRIPANPLLKVLPVAVGGKDQPITMNVFASRCASVLGSLSPGEATETHSVEMITLPEFCRRVRIEHIDLLKLDIEGAEIDLFDSASDQDLQAATQITVEFHDFIYPEQAPAVANIRERMSDIGFWVLPFSLDNTDVLFLNKQSNVSAAEVAYMRSFVRYGKGFVRRLRRLAS
jgi:FkbM family methyltransferase